jgi:hypothetical protein
MRLNGGISHRFTSFNEPIFSSFPRIYFLKIKKVPGVGSYATKIHASTPSWFKSANQ